VSYKDKLRWWGLVPQKKAFYDDWGQAGWNPQRAANLQPFVSDSEFEGRPWKSWFAWRPILLDDDSWVWMRHAFRRRYFAQATRTYKWAYGSEFEVLKTQ